MEYCFLGGAARAARSPKVINFPLLRMLQHPCMPLTFLFTKSPCGH